MPPSDCFRNEEEKEAFEALATPLDLLIRVHLAKASDNTDLWRRVFSIEAEEVTEFVSSQSRADLYRTLRTNSVINDTDFSDAVTLLRPGSPMGDHVLKALQSQSSRDSGTIGSRTPLLTNGARRVGRWTVAALDTRHRDG